MTEVAYSNARVVLPDAEFSGTVIVTDGLISGIDTTITRGPAEDLEGDYLIPGLVELHTDHLESHYHPRPGVAWPATSSVMAHDAQIAASGITTVFDALRAGTFEPNDLLAKHAVTLIGAIEQVQRAGHLRAEHMIHVRCELPCPDTSEALDELSRAGALHLVSIMDHTPGARQFTSLDKFKEYYFGKKIILPERMDTYIAERLEMQAKHASTNKKRILEIVRDIDVRLASHDDATVAHVEEAVADGASIAEFPTTKEAAEAAHHNGLAVMMGAPNVVRGGSHSGNIAAASVAANGNLDVLSSDYVPSSLLSAVFQLSSDVEGMDLPAAVKLVTANPARAGGLSDRGAIEVGKRADFIQVRVVDGLPVVRRVWREGKRVM